VERMATELGCGPGDSVIEIGPGLGALTAALLATGATVHAIEIDPQLIKYLRKTFDSERLFLIEADARTVSIDEIVPEHRKYDLAANLPYSSAPAILRHFLESERPPDRSICMVQREVALRMSAEPPDMSILGIAVQLYATACLLFDVPPEAFVPKPKVISSVVLLERRTDPPVEVAEREAFFRLVSAGFAQKRKTVLNSLSSSLPAGREATRALLERAKIDPMRRAETLSISEWVALLQSMNSV
jgi:16S rRNA (adenine1518-N6/adenine1519-N6)-dimethyltransferase